MIRGLISGVVGSGSGRSTGTMAPLPTVTTETAAQINDSNAYFNGGSATRELPAGDWSIGGWVHFPSSVPTWDGCIFGCGTYNDTTNMFQFYRSNTGSFSVYGYDSAGNPLGSSHPKWSTSQYSAIGGGTIPLDTPTHICLVKTGSLLRLYVTPIGHAPRLIGEHFTSFGALTTGGCNFGSDSNYTTIKMQFAKWFKLSYALTANQIAQVINGTDPTTLGTPAATDWYFLFANAGATQTSTINGVTKTRFLSTGYSTVAGFWYAPQTEAVFPAVLGVGDGHVFQQADGTAAVTVSGVYVGTDGADIQAQLIDQDGACFSGWETIQKAATGGVFSGVIDVPMKKRWVRVQLRKVINDVVSTQVMTSTVRFGVGEVIFLGGQSLMQHMGDTAYPMGSATRTPNGFWSRVLQGKKTVAGVGQDYINVSNVTDAGGLIKITHATPHGLKTGDKVYPVSIGGTTEANSNLWTITVVSRTAYTLDGSVFVNAYTSGGYVYMTTAGVAVAGSGTADASIVLAEAVTNERDCVVALANVAIGGTGIQFFNAEGGIYSYGVFAAMMAHSLGKVGTYLWLHGHADIGSTAYFSSGGSAGAWTGYGALGTLLDWNTNKFPNDNMRFGVAAFTAVGGNTVGSAYVTHQFRFGMKDWVDRKIADGVTKVFFAGHYHDLQPQSENSVMNPNAHLYPTFKGYLSQAARLGHAAARKLAADTASIPGPELASATRSGATITLTVTHRGGSSLRTLATGAKLSGFEVATTTNFASPLTISNAQITGANTITLTLASDPGATCYVRYMYGQPGDYPISTAITSRISGVADNGAGLIRVTMSSGTAQQRAGGHGLVTGDWTTIEGVKDSNGTSPANGTWKVTVIDTENFDLVGSSSAGLGTFTAGQTIYGTSRLPTASKELATPVYDDRVVAGVDSLGLPLQPTYTYVTAA